MPLVIDCYLEDDFEFHQILSETLKETGQIGDVMPFMIQRNAPLLILQYLWPVQYKLNQLENTSLALAVAEEGWKGRISNIKSTLTVQKKGHTIQFHKSHVIDASKVMLICNYSQSELAICSFLLSDDRIIREKRKDKGLSLPISNKDHSYLDNTDQKTSKAQAIHHARIRGHFVLTDLDDFLVVSKEKYSEWAKGISSLEISSIAILSLALLDYYGILVPENIKKLVPLVFQARKNSHSLKRGFVLSRNILRFFYSTVNKKSIQIHPFWFQIQKVFRF